MQTIDYKKYIKFAKEYLGITGKINIILTNDKSKVETFAYYQPDNNLIMCYVKNRSLPDCLRSLYHELVHQWQHEQGMLDNIESNGADGSPIENEANAKAGEMMRKLGKLYPEIYQD